MKYIYNKNNNIQSMDTGRARARSHIQLISGAQASSSSFTIINL